MAKKFSIKRDPTFTTTVNLPSPGQAPVPVEFTFKWMDRKSLAEFIDSRSDYYKSLMPKATEEEWGNVEWSQAVAEYEFPQLKKIIHGWAIEEEFNDENLRLFVESHKELPAAVANAYIEAYDGAIKGN